MEHNTDSSSLSDFLVEVMELVSKYAAELVAFFLGLFI